MKPYAVLALASVASVLLAGCGHKPIDDWCLLNEPRLLTLETLEAMTQDEVDQTLAFNEYGAERCGWKPYGE